MDALRSGEPALGSLTPKEQSWLTTAFTQLKQIYEKRETGRPGDNACCVFDAGNIYVQFLAPWDAKQLECEAVSAKFVPEIATILTTEGEETLRRLGFKPPEISPNYSRTIKIEGVEDLAYAARLAFRVLKHVYRVADFGSATFTEKLPRNLSTDQNIGKTYTKPLLFQTDPKKFMELLMMDDAKKRQDALKANFDDVILCEIIRYGIFNDAKMIGPLAQLYEKEVVPNYTEEKRWELYRHIIGMIENVEFVSVNALLPFIAEEPSRRIVSTTVIDYVSLGPLTNNDPMSRPKDIIGMIKNGQMKNRGAAFGGLLHLGDPRVCKLLWPIRDFLQDDDVNTAVNCSTGFLYSASQEFEIDWLAEMQGNLRHELFGLVASGLVLQKRNNKFDAVFTGQREFPVSKNLTPADQKRSQELAKPISIEEYTKRIAPRLYELERAEPPPRVMPYVLSMWNLTPATDPSEAAGPGDGAMTHKEIMDQLRSRPCKLVVAAGIVNPFGPTLAGLVLLRIAGGLEWELFSFNLNPFSQELKRLRPAEAVEATHPSKIVAEAGIGLAGAPTILIFSTAPSQEIIATAKVIASASNNLASTVDLLRKFPGNPWDRISREIESSSSETKSEHYRSATAKDIDDYVATILDNKNFSEEFAAFSEAWKGSIKFQESSRTGLANTAMPFSDLQEAVSIIIEPSRA